MSQEQAAVAENAENLPHTLPILPLFDAVLFPKMVLPLMVMQGESIQLIDEAMTKDRYIGLVVAKKAITKDSNPSEDLESVGTSALIMKMAKTDDNRAQLLVQVPPGKGLGPLAQLLQRAREEVADQRGDHGRQQA